MWYLPTSTFARPRGGPRDQAIHRPEQYSYFAEETSGGCRREVGVPSFGGAGDSRRRISARARARKRSLRTMWCKNWSARRRRVGGGRGLRARRCSRLRATGGHRLAIGRSVLGRRSVAARPVRRRPRPLKWVTNAVPPLFRGGGADVRRSAPPSTHQCRTSSGRVVRMLLEKRAGPGRTCGIPYDTSSEVARSDIPR
jgi:hypothetical protein